MNEIHHYVLRQEQKLNLHNAMEIINSCLHAKTLKIKHNILVASLKSDFKAYEKLQWQEKTLSFPNRLRGDIKSTHVFDTPVCEFVSVHQSSVRQGSSSGDVVFVYFKINLERERVSSKLFIDHDF